LRRITVAAIITTSLFWHLKKYVSQEMLNTRSSPEKPPFVSFIIPSKLDRYSLDNTISSLQNQTETSWEAIVGVDVDLSTYKSISDITSKSKHFRYDERIRYVPIHSNSTNRGEIGNGAGGLRNEIITNFARADWVAFVDDDDTLSPFYVEHLREGVRQDEYADIFIFRMQWHDGRTILPPPGESLICKNCVGISYAVRRELFVRPAGPLAFIPDRREDFYFLRSAQEQSAVIKLSSEVTYFVKTLPSLAKFKKSTFERATVATMAMQIYCLQIESTPYNFTGLCGYWR